MPVACFVHDIITMWYIMRAPTFAPRLGLIIVGVCPFQVGSILYSCVPSPRLFGGFQKLRGPNIDQIAGF